MSSPSRYRRRKPHIPNFALGVSLVIWALLTWAGYRAFSTDQAGSGLWGCEMAYMYPSFTPLDDVEGTRSRYSLYLYREGRIDRPTPSGHPVIFIPGNAGSFKQARSIGASAAVQFHAQRDEALKWGKNVDLFTVDFNEDFSALHAPTLRSQAQFLASAIPRVLRAYDHLPLDERPTKVTLLGHSMGGIVARLAMTSSPNTMVDAIVTMSTPHLQPPAPLDYEMERIYSEINSVDYRDPAPLLISICGGASDVQIVSDSCALSNNLVGPGDGFAVFSSGIPGVWTGVEHQAMVWCDQMRFRVARTLLEMGEFATRQGKLAVAYTWLLGQSQPKVTDETIDSVTRVEVMTPNTSILIRLAHTTEESLVEPPLSARLCRAEGDCSMQTFSTTVAPWLPLSEQPFPLLGEGSRPQDSVFVLDFTQLDTEGWLEVRHPRDAWVHSGAFVDQHAVRSQWASEESNAPAHLALHFPTALVSSVVAYRLSVEIEQCSNHMPTMRFTSQPGSPLYDPSFESRFYPLRTGSVTLHSHISGSPYQGNPQYTKGISIDVYQHPNCHVRSISLSVDPVATLAKAMLRLRISVLAWCVGWVGIILFCQLNRYSSSGALPSFSSIVEELAPRLSIVVAGLAAVAVAAQHLGDLLKLPSDQLLLGLTHVAYLPLVLLVAIWSWGSVMLLHTLLQTTLRLFDKLLRTTQEKRGTKPETLVNTWAISSRVVLGLLLLGLIRIVIPYRLALGILYVVQFTLTVNASTEGPSSRVHLLDTLMLLLTFLLPFNLPALAVWGRNFWKHGQHAFPEDRAILPVLPVLVLVLVTTLEQPLTTVRLVRRAAKWGAAAFAVLAFTIAPRRPYILMLAVNFAFALTSLLMAATPTSQVSGAGEG